MTAPSLPPAVAPAALTESFRASGVLGTGAVREVTVLSARETVVSHIIRLKLAYDGPTPDAPATLILKLPHANYVKAIWHGGRHEVMFYHDVAPLMPPRLVPGSYGGAWDEDALTWHLLLEDLTDTHQTATMWPLPPTQPQATAIVKALGRLHAAWWDHPQLGTSIGRFANREDTDKHGAVFADHYRRFADQLGDRLSADRRAVYDRFIAAAPRLLDRYHQRRNLAIAHGDAHVWNFLVPKDAGGGDVRPFDFDQWHVATPASDLAYMIALHLYPERRAAIERPLLDAYHATLLDHGVRAYDRAALAQDYRRAVLWHITKPVWQWSIDIPPLVWWNNLERIFLAVDDLGCRDLLD